MPVKYLAAALLGLSLLSSPLSAATLSPKDRQIYQQAFSSAANGRYQEALSLSTQASDKLAAKVLQWMTYKQSGNGYSFQEITGFIAANPAWPHERILRRRAEVNIKPSTPPRELVAWFEKNPPLTLTGNIAYIQALRSLKETKKAQEEIRNTWTTINMEPAQETNFLSLYGKQLTAKDHAARMSRLLWDRRFTDAKRMYAHVDDAHKALGEARIALNKREGNANTLLQKVPASLRNDPGLIFERVRWRRLNDMPAEAMELMLAHPEAVRVQADKWWVERGFLVRKALQQRLSSQAYQIAQGHGQKEGVGFAEAEWMAGWIALRFLNDPKRAYPHFVTLYEGVKTPASRTRGAYWAGRTAEAMKDEKTARTWYERATEHGFTYHGQLAVSKLGNSAKWTFPADPLPSSQDIKTFENHELTRVVRILAELGLSDETPPFLLRLNDVAETPGQRTLAANLATTTGRPDMAVFIARRAESAGVPLISTGYPIPDLQYESRPEKSLVLGLIRQESAFHTTAVSSAGARGLMQLMPDTAKQVAKKLGVPYSGVSQLTSDPSFNIRLGTSYLRTQLEDFGGSYIMALAAYNAGPHRVKRWMNDFGDPRNPSTDAIDWVEMIPFTETRNYVQRVMENTQIYRHRLGETAMNTSLEKDLNR